MKTSATGRAVARVRGGERFYMDETRNTLKIIGMVLLGLFAVVVGIPLILAALGVVAVTSLVIFAKLVGLAILAIKLAVVVAVVYLVVVGIRALLK
ncbi:MAG: hypothetical protein ACJ8LM_16720 [Candidatus Udaeobacter sp.]|jgi:hypothetical protein